MKKKPNKKEEQEKLRIENELKKLKLNAEHGGVFHTPKESKLPPEVENQFLNYIEQFENAFSKNKQIKLYDFIGKPSYKKLEELSENKIATELNRLNQILNKNGVSLDTICQVDDKELYRFITEELFYHEMDDIRIEGMVNHFTYEDFYPNHEYDLDRDTNDFFIQLIKHDFNPEYIIVSKNFKLRNESLTDKTFHQKVRAFREAFESFHFDELEILDFDIKKRVATVKFYVKITAVIEGNKEQKILEGEGSFKFKHQYGYWCISGLNLPEGIL